MITLLLIIANVIASYAGFRSDVHRDKYIFNIDRILMFKEYPRLISSGFLHANWIHLIMNMFGLLSLGLFVESRLDSFPFLFLYLGSLLGGNLLALYIHRNHGDYAAYGASGAVSGVVFAFAVLEPSARIFFFPSWLFALLFVALSLYGIKKNWGNIGHDAHLGGAFTGMLLTIFFKPQAFIDNWWVVLICGLPTAAFFYVLVKHPAFLLVDDYFSLRRKKIRRNEDGTVKLSRSKELDQLLDKINKVGYEGLTPKEKERLRDLSNR